MSGYTPTGDSPSSGPSTTSSPSHAQWLKRQFSRDGESEPWPDLLIDRRSLQERRQIVHSGVIKDPSSIERSNLIGVSQLVVKAVVDTSLRHGRQLDSENVPLHQLFVVLDICLRHGIKTERRLLGGRRDLWDLLQTVERLDQAASEITATARDLTTVKTAAGRARAFIRLSVMQKKLADYVKQLVDNKDILADFYEPESLLRCEEGVLLAGVLVSLNIVDCNLCLKDEDLDCQEGVIDLTYYLRRKEDVGRLDVCDDTEQVEQKDFNALVDQKNYIEEVNRNLAANAANLQARVDSLTNSNALMREDLAITKRKVGSLEVENNALTLEVEKQANMISLTNEVNKYNELDPSQESEVEVHLNEEKTAKIELEKELHLEIQMKAEMEMAMKLLEKDVHEKQDGIVSLRGQLEDIKSINLEMYTKLAECEKSLAYKSDMIQRLEIKTIAMGDTLQQLDKKFVESEKNCQVAKTSNIELTAQLAETETRYTELEEDVKIERGWRERLQEAHESDQETISSLKQETDFLRQVQGDYDHLRQENSRLRETVKEGDQTLEELGQQLSWSKLQVDTMKEEVVGVVSAGWEEDSKATNCKFCTKDFNLARRKHHCRNCGGIFCDDCSDNKMKLPSSAKSVRVCDTCYTLLLDRQSKLP